MTPRAGKTDFSYEASLASGDKAARPPEQRLDKWLWYARVVKSRSLAQAMIEAGRVRLNKVKVDKPRQIVRPDDVLTITVHHKIRVLKVLEPGTRRGPAAEAQLLYDDLTPTPPPEVSAAGDPRPAGVAVREAGAARPTKRDRRKMDALRGRDD